MINAQSANTKNSFEIISFAFKKDISKEQQKTAMAALNAKIIDFPGFLSRDYYYSQEQQRWIDFAVWTDLQSAQDASKKMMEDATALEIFGMIEESSMIFTHYHHEGGIKASS